MTTPNAPVNPDTTSEMAQSVPVKTEYRKLENTEARAIAFLIIAVGFILFQVLNWIGEKYPSKEKLAQRQAQIEAQQSLRRADMKARQHEEMMDEMSRKSREESDKRYRESQRQFYIHQQKVRDDTLRRQDENRRVSDELRTYTTEVYIDTVKKSMERSYSK